MIFLCLEKNKLNKYPIGKYNFVADNKWSKIIHQIQRRTKPVENLKTCDNALRK